jgi:hypothetical protein
MSLLKQVSDTLPAYIHTLPEKNKPAIWLPKEHALQYERIRLHGNDRHFLIVDYDVKNGNAAKDHNHYDLEPNFLTYNYENPNHQAFFRIQDPVHVQNSSKFNKPNLYLKAIERAYDDKYNGDKHFARYISRNPLLAFSDTDWRHDRKYSLSELAEVVNLNQQRIKVGDRQVQGTGRNREVFDDLRQWAYKQDTGNISYEQWLNKVLIKAIGYNTYKTPMALNEVESIAKSVSQYTYQKNFNQGDYAAFCARQAERGRKGGLISKGGGRPKSATALDKTKPWLELNISRSTYFRRKKENIL